MSSKTKIRIKLSASASDIVGTVLIVGENTAVVNLRSGLSTGYNSLINISGSFTYTYDDSDQCNREFVLNTKSYRTYLVIMSASNGGALSVSIE